MDSRALVVKVALRDCGFKESGCKGGFERLWIQGIVAPTLFTELRPAFQFDRTLPWEALWE